MGGGGTLGCIHLESVPVISNHVIRPYQAAVEQAEHKVGMGHGNPLPLHTWFGLHSWPELIRKSAERELVTSSKFQDV